MSQTTIKGLPVFVAEMGTESCGMLKVSLVDYPAVEKNFLAFASEPTARRYAVQDEDKHIVRGVLMRANYPIYRKDKELGEYFIIYKPETLREMAEQYLQEGRSSNVNLMHEDGSDVEGVDMVQLFIKDSENGIDPAGFEEIEDGSLFAEYKVSNEEVWQGIKDGTYRGFSIETLNTIEEENAVISTEKIQDVLDWLDSSFCNDMNIKKQIKSKLAAMLGKFGNVTTDKATLSWDGDGELEAGMEVYILDEEGNRQAVEDGDYTTEDGKVIVVVDGKVSEIKDPDAEVGDQGEEGEELKSQKMARIAKFEESYEEKERKMSEAIAAVNGEGFYFYLVEAGEGYAVICWYTGDDWSDHFRRYEMAQNEDGSFTVGESVEGHMGFIADEAEPAPAPAEEPAEEDETMAEAMSAVLDELKTLKADMADVKKRLGEPAAKPAHEEFKAEPKAPKATDPAYKKFVERFSKK